MNIAKTILKIFSRQNHLSMRLRQIFSSTANSSESPQEVQMNKMLLPCILFLLLPVTCYSGESEQAPLFTLSEALQTAYQNNPILREADLTHGSSLAEVRRTQADFFVKASAHYNFANLQDAPYQRINGNQMQVGDRDVHHWDVTLTQPLFTGFALTSRYQMARISSEIKKLEKERALLDISQAVKTAWFSTLLARKMETVTNKTVTALTAHEKDAKEFYKHGVIPHNDLLKSQVALANAVQEREKAQATTQISRSRLNTLLGIDINSEKIQEDTDSVQPLSYDLPGLMSEAINNSPVLASYRLGLENLDQAITLAKSPYYPELALSGKYEQNGNDLGAETNAYSNEHNATVAITAKWDFFEWGKTGADVEKQRLAKQALQEKMKGVEDQIRFETKSAYFDLNVAGNNIGTAQKGLEQARENARITDLQYQSQVTTSTEVLDSLTLLSQAEGNYYRALYGYMVALANLERAVGRK
jgi:outer membrane protein